MVGNIAMSGNHLDRVRPRGLAAAELPLLQRRAADSVIKDLCQGDWCVFGQQGQPGVARRVGRFGKQDIHTNAAHLISGKQNFQQVGNPLARPWPRPKALQAGFVDINHRHPVFRLQAGADLMLQVAQRFIKPDE